jgi:bifunctional UDP-N-acetylglucosamine pyrophosphorylase/glucosamine-1-phosphate N-acetyltransferase
MCDRLGKIDNNNAQDEYYLTDLIDIAVQEGQTIASSPVTPEEGIGINTPEHRDMAEKILTERQ